MIEIEIEFIMNRYDFVRNINRANNWKTEMWKIFIINYKYCICLRVYYEVQLLF